MTKLDERIYLTQYSMRTLTQPIRINGVLADPDANTVACLLEAIDGTDIVARAAARVSTGLYTFTPSTIESKDQGYFNLHWGYAISSVAQRITMPIEIGPQSAAYEALTDDALLVVSAVWRKFADLYDSPFGGPHLLVPAQSHFSKARIAELLSDALGELNTAAQPYTSFTLDGAHGSQVFPYERWAPLLAKSGYIETIKHLMRSYTEQWEIAGIAGPRADRRDYLARWGSILVMEEKTFQKQIETWKRSLIGLGQTRVLVAGGVYGNAWNTYRQVNAARPRFPYG